MKTTSFEMAFIIRVFMQDVENFYRCLVSDASSRALLKIWDILADDSMDDPECFQRIEAVVHLMEDLGIPCGGQHDFR